MNFDWSVLGAPLLAGLLVTATHVVLGRRVLERGIIFIDLTIAQIAALGAVAWAVAGLPEGHGWGLAAAGSAAFMAAALLAWTERKLPDLQEAIIGSLYVVAASFAILLVAHSPHGSEHLEELLAGQILWVGFSQVWPVAVIYLPLLALWIVWARHRPAVFYFVFAVAVMVSVQLVGVFLVFASLILPALATHGLSERRGLALGYGVSAVGYAFGLWLSVPLDLPAGPLIVCVLASLALLTGLVRYLAARR